MAERLRRTVRSLFSGLRYITLAPPRPRRHVRRDPARHWIRAGERLSRATEEVGRALAQ
jgi:hypothetical protein